MFFLNLTFIIIFLYGESYFLFANIACMELNIQSLQSTQDILNYTSQFSEDSVKNLPEEILVQLQEKINFREAYEIMAQDYPDSAIDIYQFYKRIFRYNAYMYPEQTQKAQILLNFIFQRNKKEVDESFARTMEMVLLGGHFLKYAVENNFQNQIFSFIISTIKLLNTSLTSPEEKNKVLELLKDFKAGDHLITWKYKESDLPNKSSDYYRRTIDALNILVKDSNPPASITWLTHGLFTLYAGSLKDNTLSYANPETQHYILKFNEINPTVVNKIQIWNKAYEAFLQEQSLESTVSEEQQYNQSSKKNEYLKKYAVRGSLFTCFLIIVAYYFKYVRKAVK